MAEKGKRGRKPWIPTPEILQQIEAMASRFLKEEQMAVLVGVSPQTFSEKKKEYAELGEAILKGRAKVAINLSNKIYEQAMAGNTSILIFLAKSVNGLRENDPIVQVNHFTPIRIIAKDKEYLLESGDSSPSKTG